eukprot:CAMPEP_0183591272 /NCGR_PEP_ID=MMETSP0371-20130417/165968_1 /TAXON_ID=268820 /ORGANISM="Peridinium aciculiferum, Strain PAER-2" /LENGTH=130 /DNA_ID=CAMNT_0025802739 /DNA_START=50 /DNA_END=440 /DNA_ORIENTATION=-
MCWEMCTPSLWLRPHKRQAKFEAKRVSYGRGAIGRQPGSPHAPPVPGRPERRRKPTRPSPAESWARPRLKCFLWPSGISQSSSKCSTSEASPPGVSANRRSLLSPESASTLQKLLLGPQATPEPRTAAAA